MFGQSEKIYRLQKEIDDLREYCIKLTNDVNTWAQAHGKLTEAIMNEVEKLKVNKQEEK